MNQAPETRAMQHLLVQGFTLYTAPALVALRIVSPALLDTHAWACVAGASAVEWAQTLPEDDALRARLIEAASRVEPGLPWTLCHLEGTFLATPLEVGEVRNALARLEVAKNLGVEPPSLDGLRAIPDDILQQEMKRRKRESGADEGVKSG